MPVRYGPPNYRDHPLGTCLLHHEMRICYVNVPKSASTTLKASLLQCGFQYSSFFEFDCSDYFSFTVLRDPALRFWSGFVEYWERERGEWRYEESGERLRYWDILSPEFLTLAADTFSVFDEHLELQLRFIEGISFNHICRCETLEDDVAMLKVRTGFALRLVPQNRYPTHRMDAFLRLVSSPEIDDAIRSKYAPDFDIYRDSSQLMKKTEAI